MNTLRDYVEWGMTHSDKTGSAEGVPLVMEKCVKNKKMKQLEVYGNSIQNGTPSPEAPVEVESVGEKCTKNLIDYRTARNRDGYSTGVITFDNDSLTYTGNYFFLIDVSIQPDKSYVLSLEYKTNGNTSPWFRLRYSDGTYSNDNFYINQSFVAPTDADNVTSLMVYSSSGGTELGKTITVTLKNLQLEEGSVATEYEPYGKYKIPVTVRGKNIFKPTVVSTNTIRITGLPSLNGPYGTVIDSTDFSDNKVIVKQTPNSDYITGAYQNGYVYFEIPELVIGKKYRLSFDLNITDNPLNATALVMYALNSPISAVSITPNRCKTTFTYKTPPTGRKPDVELRCGGASFELSNVMITEEGQDDTFEPYTEPITTNVYLNEPLGSGDVLNFKDKKVSNGYGFKESVECDLPTLTAQTSIIEIETTVAPSNMKGKYIKR